MRYKKTVIISSMLSICNLVFGDTAERIEQELIDISKEIAAITGKEVSFQMTTPSPQKIVIVPPKAQRLTKQETEAEFDGIETNIAKLSSKNINDVIDQITNIYRTIYKKDRSYRKAKGKQWEKFDFDIKRSVPILFLQNKKRLAKIINLFHKKAIRLRKTKNKRELEWLRIVAQNLKNIEKHPQVYDHYYGLMHHTLFQIFAKANLLTKYLQQERINKEIQLIELNIKKLFQDHTKYENYNDLMNIIKQYIKYRNNQTINLPMPMYRWYGPKIPNIPYDKLVTKDLDKKNQNKRLEALRDLLMNIQNYMEINKKDAFEKYRIERLPETIKAIDLELKE